MQWFGKQIEKRFLPTFSFQFFDRSSFQKSVEKDFQRAYGLPIQLNANIVNN